VALVLVLAARGARGRQAAIIAFVVQLVLNLAWPPLFFSAHQIRPGCSCSRAAGRGDGDGGAVLAGCGGWRGCCCCPIGVAVLALALNYEIDRLNPNGGALAPRAAVPRSPSDAGCARPEG
jgi:tryptophan-rich sensory protein